MKDTLHPGATATFSYRVPAEKTVPHLYPEAPEFREMPTVFATGFMVGLMEWTCLKVLQPHLDPGEGSLGVHIDVSHIRADGARPDGDGRGDLHEGGGTARVVRRQGPRRHRCDRRRGVTSA